MILKRMKRRHTREDAIEFCNAVTKKRPDVVFGADIITGFPTETEDMFENSMKMVDDCNLTYLHVFPYSERKGTPAARMPQMDRSIRKARGAKLRALGEEKLDAFLSSQVGNDVEILVEKAMKDENAVLGHTEHFAPAKILGKYLDNLKSGYIAKARVTGYQDGILLTEVINV